MDRITIESLDLIDKQTGDKHILSIFYDESSESPREWANVGKMLCWHDRYSLGDENPHHSFEDLFISLIEKNGVDENHDLDQLDESQLWKVVQEIDDVVIMPLYLYDHSGITISTSRFSDYWDSGQVGFIYAEKNTVMENCVTSNRDWKEVAKEALEGEVEAYDTFLRGDVYEFTIEAEVECQSCHHVEKEIIDSCGGFYGNEWQNNGLFEHAGIGTEYTIVPDIEERAI